MDWFLYDNGLRHERVKVGSRAMEKSLLRFGSYIHHRETGYNLPQSREVGYIENADKNFTQYSFTNISGFNVLARFSVILGSLTISTLMMPPPSH